LLMKHFDRQMCKDQITPNTVSKYTDQPPNFECEPKQVELGRRSPEQAPAAHPAIPVVAA